MFLFFVTQLQKGLEPGCLRYHPCGIRIGSFGTKPGPVLTRNKSRFISAIYGYDLAEQLSAEGMCSGGISCRSRKNLLPKTAMLTFEQEEGEPAPRVAQDGTQKIGLFRVGGRARRRALNLLGFSGSSLHALFEGTDSLSETLAEFR
jgi:hypothetical protein